MQYKLLQMKIEQLVSYFNENSIDLSPAFQRGTVWGLKLRRALLKNILREQPVPAIFLFKESLGSKDRYVILDGKQRVESILLFIADKSGDLKIGAWKAYFSGEQFKQAHFKAEINGQKKALYEMTEDEIRRFRSYLLSIIEIELEENANLDDVIQLFVDINSHGKEVERFQMVKSLYLDDPLLRQIFELVGENRRRGRDRIYKIYKNAFTKVLVNLDVVRRVEDQMAKVDVMWEKLVELALFMATSKHRKPAQILKEFISKRRSDETKYPLTRRQLAILTRVFIFIEKLYKNFNLSTSRLAKDQTHFYVLVTLLINEAKNNKVFTSTPEGIAKFSNLLDGKKMDGISKNVRKTFKEYMELSEKQTTDASKREQRVSLLNEVLKAI